jgi:hypothetical protein
MYLLWCPMGGHIVAALPVCSSVRLSVRFYLENNLKTIGDNLFKQHKVVEGIEAQCSDK